MAKPFHPIGKAEGPGVQTVRWAEGPCQGRQLQQPRQEGHGGGTLRVGRHAALGLTHGDVHRGGQRVAVGGSGVGPVTPGNRWEWGLRYPNGRVIAQMVFHNYNSRFSNALKEDHTQISTLISSVFR